MHIQGMDKIMETLQLLYTITMVLDHLLPSIQLLGMDSWTRTSFKQTLVEFYNVLLEEHLQVALEMLALGICSHSSLKN
jgi:hypothetical protein